MKSVYPSAGGLPHRCTFRKKLHIPLAGLNLILFIMSGDGFSSPGDRNDEEGFSPLHVNHQRLPGMFNLRPESSA